jgi:hypothetical protein
MTNTELLEIAYSHCEVLRHFSKDIQLAVIKERTDAIQFIPKPSLKVQLVAVRQDGELIKFIKKPSEKVQLEALKQNINAKKYIKYPSEKVKSYITYRKNILRILQKN